MTGWMDDAACTTEDPEAFFAVGNGGRGMGTHNIDAEALAICARCKVIDACRDSDLTIALSDTWGVLAGRTEDERRSAKKTAEREAWKANRAAVRAKSSAKNREYAKQARVVLPSSRRAS